MTSSSSASPIPSKLVVRKQSLTFLSLLSLTHIARVRGSGSKALLRTCDPDCLADNRKFCIVCSKQQEIQRLRARVWESVSWRLIGNLWIIANGIVVAILLLENCKMTSSTLIRSTRRLSVSLSLLVHLLHLILSYRWWMAWIFRCQNSSTTSCWRNKLINRAVSKDTLFWSVTEEVFTLLYSEHHPSERIFTVP